MFNPLEDARKAKREGDLIMAMTMYHAYLRENPNDVQALNEAADCDYQQGLMSMAFDKLVRSLDIKPTPLAFWIMAKYQIHHMGRDSARDCLAKALALDPDFHYAHNTRAIMQIDERQPEAAIESSEAGLRALAREFAKRIDQDLRPLGNGGRLAMPEKTTGMLWNKYARYAAVEIATKHGIEEIDWPADGYGTFEEGMVPTDFWVDYRPGQQAGQAQPTPPRRRYLVNFVYTYLQLVRHSGYGVMLYTKSRALKAAGRLEEAEAHEQEAREFGAEPPAALTSGGQSKPSATSILDGIVVYPGAVERQGRTASTPRSGLEKAAAEMGARKWAAAIGTLQSIDDPTVDQAVVQKAIGRCYQQLERFHEAILHTKRALKIQPSIPVLDQLAKIYSAMGNLEEAISYFKQGTKLDPDSAITFNNLGAALYRQGRFLPACRNYRYALEATARCIAKRMVEEFGDRGPVNTLPADLKGRIWLDHAQYAAQFLCDNAPEIGAMVWPKDAFGAFSNADPSVFWEDLKGKRKLWQRSDPVIARNIRPNFIATFFVLLCEKQYIYTGFLKNLQAGLEKSGNVGEAKRYEREFKEFEVRTRVGE